MLIDKLEGHPESMVQPVRVSYFDPSTGKPCDAPTAPKQQKRRGIADGPICKRPKKKAVCAVCGAEFYSTSRSLTCSVGCAEEYRRRRAKEARDRRRKMGGDAHGNRSAD